MLRVRSININSRQYWDSVYRDNKKRQEYVDDTLFSKSRFNKTLDFITNGQKFLDIGCGVGKMTKLVKDTYPKCEVWGTDISDIMIEIDKIEHKGIKYLYQKIGNQKEVPDNYFDVVFSGEVLEHLDYPEDVFIDACRVLKKGGKFIITTPFKDFIQSNEHVWSYDKKDIKKLYLDNGFINPKIEVVYPKTIFAIGEK